MGKLDGKRGSSRRVQERIGRIFDGIQEGKTELQIAQEEGVSDRQIRYDMRKPEYQIRMDAFLTEISRVLPGWIKELHDSKDPQDKRTAATLFTQMLKSGITKRSEALTVNMDLDIPPDDVMFGDVFDKLTPEEQAPFIAAYRDKQVPRFVDSESKVVDVTPDPKIDP